MCVWGGGQKNEDGHKTECLHESDSCQVVDKSCCPDVKGDAAIKLSHQSAVRGEDSFPGNDREERGVVVGNLTGASHSVERQVRIERGSSDEDDEDSSSCVLLPIRSKLNRVGDRYYCTESDLFASWCDEEEYFTVQM